MYWQRIKTFLLLMFVMPTVFLLKAQEDVIPGNGEVEPGADGSAAYWNGWGWFWFIMLLLIVALSIWYAFRPGKPQQRGKPSPREGI